MPDEPTLLRPLYRRPEEYVLLITFGSVLAMGLPILSALFGIGIGISLVFLFANWVSVPNFTPQIASMIGIGVGIDYGSIRQTLHDI